MPPDSPPDPERLHAELETTDTLVPVLQQESAREAARLILSMTPAQRRLLIRQLRRAGIGFALAPLTVLGAFLRHHAREAAVAAVVLIAAGGVLLWPFQTEEPPSEPAEVPSVQPEDPGLPTHPPAIAIPIEPSEPPASPETEEEDPALTTADTSSTPQIPAQPPEPESPAEPPQEEPPGPMPEPTATPEPPSESPPEPPSEPPLEEETESPKEPKDCSRVNLGLAKIIVCIGDLPGNREHSLGVSPTLSNLELRRQRHRKNHPKVS